MPLDQAASTARVALLVPTIRCAGCIRPIETALMRQPGVVSARVNLTNRQVAVSYDPALIDPDRLLDAVGAAGHSGRLAADGDQDAGDTVGRDLLLRIGVAGFAAMNVMLLSISVWSGADGAIRDLLHWVSAFVALPAMAYAGMPFYRSAARALRARRVNMDVPITLAIALSAASSLFETSNSGEHAFFDAGIMLIFFLLVGRYLDHRMRERARTAAGQLMQMAGRYATEVDPGGQHRRIAVGAIRAGMTLSIPAGARVPADGRIVEGHTELDCALITGESAPVEAALGDEVLAGYLNITAPITIDVTRASHESHLAEISRLIDAAQAGRGRFDRIADRAARLYAPVVHALAALAFAGWLWATGDLRIAIQIAAAVLIITCPCALALAVPAVHTAASGWLMRNGIFLKSGDALERLDHIDTVALDKTGTVTTGQIELESAPPDDDPAWAVARALAERSTHPYSVAIARRADGFGVVPADLAGVREHPGKGVSAMIEQGRVRLGKPGWIAGPPDADALLELPDGTTRAFYMRQTLRPDAAETCANLERNGYAVVMLTGDRAGPASEVAAKLGLAELRAGLDPKEKHADLTRRSAAGHHVLMVGDGLNDTPALAEAAVSMAPGGAADIAQNLADIVFTGERLAPVATVLRIAKLARIRARQCIAIATVYNLIAVPVALAGYVTPLFAAVAMSASSLIVILNALRIGDRV